MRKDAPLFGIAWSPDGRAFATWCGETCEGIEGEPRTQVLVWSVPDLRIRTSFEVNETDTGNGRVFWVAFSPDGSRIAASTENEVSLWRTEEGSLVTRIPVPRVYWNFEFSPDGRFLRAGGASSRLVVVESATGRELLSDRLGNNVNSQTTRWTRDSKQLFAEASTTLAHWRVDSGKRQLTRIDSLGEWNGSLELSRDDRFVYLGAPEACTGALFSTETLKAVRRFPKETVCLAKFSPASDELAAIHRDGSVTISPLGKGPSHTVSARPGRGDLAPSEQTLDYSPDGRRIAWGRLGELKVARVADGALLGSPAPPVLLHDWRSETEIGVLRDEGKTLELFDVEKRAVVRNEVSPPHEPTPFLALDVASRGDLHLLRDDGAELFVRAAFVKEDGKPNGVWRVAIVDPEGHAGGDASLVATDVYDVATGAKTPARVEPDLAARFFTPILARGLAPSARPSP